MIVLATNCTNRCSVAILRFVFALQALRAQVPVVTLVDSVIFVSRLILRAFCDDVRSFAIEAHHFSSVSTFPFSNSEHEIGLSITALWRSCREIITLTLRICSLRDRQYFVRFGFLFVGRVFDTGPCQPCSEQFLSPSCPIFKECRRLLGRASRHEELEKRVLFWSLLSQSVKEKPLRFEFVVPRAADG
jgi:hypothetical protein